MIEHGDAVCRLTHEQGTAIPCGPLARPERGAPDQPHDQPPADQQPGDIGERIPAQAELVAADGESKQGWIDIGEGEDESHVGSGLVPADVRDRPRPVKVGGCTQGGAAPIGNATPTG